MENKQEENHDISPAKSALDDNWNERKHLVELEFNLRSKTEELIQERASRAEIDKARQEEAECRASLTRNSEQYEALVTTWVSEVLKEN